MVRLESSGSSIMVRSNSFHSFWQFGLTIRSGHNTPPAGTVQVIGNNFLHVYENSTRPAAAIMIYDGIGHSVIGNSLTADADVGLLRLTYPDLTLPPLPNDDGSLDSDGGSNHQLNWPTVGPIMLSGSQFQFQVAVNTIPLSGNYTFHLYRCRADQWFHGQPEVLIATGTGSANAIGTVSYTGTVNINGLLGDGDYVCATVTSSDGSTSEVGKALWIRGGPDLEADGVSDATESRSPGRRSPGQLRAYNVPGDGDGDGIADNLQASVCSVPVAGGALVDVGCAGWLQFQQCPAGQPGSGRFSVGL